MLRFSVRSLNVFRNLINRKVSSFSGYKTYRTLIHFRHNVIQTRHSSGGKLLNSAIQQPEDNDNKNDEEEARKRREQSWRTMKLTLIVFGVSFTCLGAYSIIILGSPLTDEDGIPIRDEFSNMSLVKAYLLRTFKEMEHYRKLIKEPSREKLLPDPLSFPYVQPKYTLVLELTDVLVHPDWTYNTGWRFKKRPLLDYFLETLKHHYEIVIYTAEQGMTVFPLIEAIDPKNNIAYKLVRDATHFSGGHHVKSLNNLNRDLTKVICVDWNANNVKFNPENLFRIKRWTGNIDDSSLVDLAAFLKAIAENEIEDVREVLQVYSDYEDPLAAFREKQKRFLDEVEAKKHEEHVKTNRWAPSLFKKPY